jgi:hypothetical protein
VRLRPFGLSIVTLCRGVLDATKCDRSFAPDGVRPGRGAEAASGLPLTVHVKSSNIDAGGSMLPLYLSVVIDGKTLELMDAAHGGNFGVYSVLPPGDYKARVSAQAVKKGGQFTRQYEFMYSDGTREIFTVVGESE